MNPGESQQQMSPPQVKVIWFLECAFERFIKEREERLSGSQKDEKKYSIYPTMLWSKYYLHVIYEQH